MVYESRICFILIIFIFSKLSFAQENSILIKGSVLDNKSKQTIEYATVALIDKSTHQIIDGTTTNEYGIFTLKTSHLDFYITISFIGFESKTITTFLAKDRSIDLGIIELDESSHIIEGVVIQAEKSQTTFQLDKRVFNVGKDLSSSGASALEVLNNVPSVNVTIEGEINLRGSSGVQVLINGKPSALANEQGNALGTITADMIEKIEVITNPSAKHDAEGTSGIINIVLKKDERKGVNGSITVNGGIPYNNSVGLSLNKRTEKFNLFTQAGFGYRKQPRMRENTTENLIDNTTLFSNATEYRNEEFYNLILGSDYYFNERNILTLSGGLAYEIEDQPSETNFSYTDSTNTILSEWYREETTEAANPKYNYELQYSSNFKNHKEHKLLFSASGNFFGKETNSDFKNSVTFGNNKDSYQQSRTIFKESNHTFKLDYTKPLSKKITIETGSQYVIQDVNNDYAVSNLIGNEWLIDSGLNNIFEYKQNVLGVYGTAAYEKDPFGLKLGLRAEHTDLKTHLLTTQESNNRNYINLFPSIHTSYKLNKKLSVQAGYSKRIYRPRLWDLNPFFTIRNSYNLRTGNPNLRPEFTDAYELTAIYIREKLSVNIGLYHRYTTENIEQISFFENNVNTVKPVNIGTNSTTGIEFNTKYQLKKWLTLNGDINFNFFARKGQFEELVFDFKANKWTTKWTSKFRLSKTFDFELTTHYLSSYKTVQGNTSQQLFADMGLRKKILKGRLICNLSVRDIFASRITIDKTLQNEFNTYIKSYRGRFIILGISYGFGKGEAMEFSGYHNH